MFKTREIPNITKTTNELFSLTDKTCVITGGSSGIGLEIVKGFASMNGNIVIIYNSTPVDELIKEISEEFPKIKITSYRCNLNNVEEIEEMIQSIIKEFGKIDIFIANAGIGWLNGGINDFKSKDELVNNWEKFIKIDLSSVYYCCAFIGKVFAKQGFGSLILTSSMSGYIINIPQLQTPYNVVKAGIRQLSKSLSIEWSNIGNGKIRVNSVSPGYVKTKLVEKMDPQLVNQWSNSIPLGRMANPKEIVGAYVYLASDASSYTTGTDIIVDGGYTSV